eukprot:TRINITY_DN1147_c0_g6_i1.p1 TRINITY_DN1147_c0_g6~~TRINITY_DN1147_c0_g6_i1.p1  ORF type:complete len:653 (+),score=227.60 TRINITY_DN1147_c0_g6_i1:190-2148(+)
MEFDGVGELSPDGPTTDPKRAKTKTLKKMLARTTTAAHIIQYISTNSRPSRALNQTTDSLDSLSLDVSAEVALSETGFSPRRSLVTPVGSPGSAAGSGTSSPLSASNPDAACDSPARQLYGSQAFDSHSSTGVLSPSHSTDGGRRTIRRTMTRVSIDNVQRSDSTARALESTLEATLDAPTRAATLVRSATEEARQAALASQPSEPSLMARDKSVPKVSSVAQAVSPVAPISVSVASPPPSTVPLDEAEDEPESDSDSSSDSSSSSDDSDDDSDEETLPQLMLEDINDPETLRDMLREEESQHEDAIVRRDAWATQHAEVREKLLDLASRTIEYKQLLWADKEALLDRLDHLDSAIDVKKASYIHLKEQVNALEAEIARLKEQYSASKVELEEILREAIQGRELEQRAQFRTLAELLEEIEKVKVANEDATTAAEGEDNELRRISDELFQCRTELLNVMVAEKEIEEQLDLARTQNELLRRQADGGAASSLLAHSASAAADAQSRAAASKPSSPAGDYSMTPPPAEKAVPPPIIVSGTPEASPGLAARSPQFAIKSFIPTRPGVKVGIKCMAEVENTIWLGMGDGTIRLINSETGMMIEERKFHTGSVNDIKCIRGKFAWSCAASRRRPSRRRTISAGLPSPSAAEAADSMR